MEKTKIYYSVKFPAKTIKSAHVEILKHHQRRKKYAVLRVDLGDETWDFDNAEEFYTVLSKSEGYYFDDILADGGRLLVNFRFLNQTTVCISSPERSVIESVFGVFEENLDISKIIITPEPIKIFIGHGKDEQWKLLKDHLHEKQGYEVVAYEIGPRAGLSVKEVLEDMQENSSFAILVMTGEDLHNDGTVHARENVIHEIGLFQGSLGFKKAVILKEDGVDEFSNILGLNQIRFAKGRISETYGDILATMKREFGEK